MEIGHPDLQLWTRPVAFSVREKVQTSNGLPSSLSRDVAPALRQNKAIRSCVLVPRPHRPMTLFFLPTSDPLALGSDVVFRLVVAERRREVPPSLAYAIVKVQCLSLWGEKKPGYNIHRQSPSHTRGEALTVRCYILALLPGVAARLAQRYKLYVGDRELRSASSTSIMIILVLLQFVNRCFILFSTFSIF